MKGYCVLIYLCIHFLLVSGTMYYIRGPSQVKDCTFTGYKPGGDVVEVGKITAPVAKLARKSISSVMGPVSQASTLAMHSLKLVQTISTAFATVSPALGPALGVFGAAAGILKSISEPKPADILNAVNTAIADLTKDMNDKIDDVKGYVDGQIITTEKELIDREYRSKFNLLVHCVSEPTKDLSNECQRDSYKDIGSSLPKFAVYDHKLTSSVPSPLSVMEAKKLEAYLVPFRNYADLVLLSLIPLVKVYKNDKTKTGQGYYKKYSNELTVKAEFFIKYAKAAVEAIEKMHDGTDHQGACPGSFECGPVKKLYEGVTWFKVNTVDYVTCTCVIDDGIKQRCSIKGEIRVDGKRLYTHYNYNARTTDDAVKEFAKRVLTRRYAVDFVAKQNKVIKEYWKQELLDFIPVWEKAIKLALPGTKVVSDVELSDEYSPRHKYRSQFARMYTNFYEDN